LTDDEFSVMKRQPLIGVEALITAAKHIEGNNFLKCAQDLISCHHEKWDGSGYPFGLKGTSIPLPGRIMAVADVYDALILHRVYKEALSHAKAVSIIVEKKGHHFDPDIVEAFIAAESEFTVIAERFADS
jgi:response regulator RpfG family c-di-GMP phosphodiesterase